MMLLIERNGSISIYRQLYEQFKARILSGALRPGERLPPVRTLALQLGISKNSVTQAYAQLYAEGYLYSRVGSGYYVTELEQGTVAVRKTIPRPPTEQEDPLLRLEYSTIHPSDFPFQKWKKCVDDTLLYEQNNILIRYSERDGVWSLRTALADYLERSRGVACTPEQLVVGSSTQELLEKLAQLFAEKQSIRNFALEEPGFDLARMVFLRQGYSVLPIRVTEIGLDCNCLPTHTPYVLYITPSHQFPTGSILPIQQRQQLLNWAAESGSYVLEDDYDSELRYASMPIPALQGIDRKQTVVYLGTTSKAFAPGLRLAYAVLPNRLVGQYQSMFQSYHNAVPDLMQRAFYQFMKRGYWEMHLRRICAADRKRHDLLVRLLRQNLSDAFRILGAGAGVHLLIESDTWTESELMERAAQVGIRVFPVSPYWTNVEQYGNHQVMLGYAMLRLEDIPSLVSRLQQAWVE